MVFLYACDGFCDRAEHDKRPAITGEFNKNWYDSTPSGDRLRQAGYEPEDLVTVCPDCVERLLLEH